MADAIDIHYHEIALKKGNRRLFVEQLLKNIRIAMTGLPVKSIKSLHGRVVLDVGPPTPRIKERLSKIPGIANFMPVFQVPAEMNLLKERVAEEIKDLKFKDFRISTKRADKSFSLTSEDINKELGAWVKEKSGAGVNLTKPEFTVFVEVLPGQILFGFEKIQGVGGLPVEVSGKAVSLLSGGIDSPVASFMMMKRGCRLVFVHFHAYPYLDRSSQEKVFELIGVLNKFQYNSRLYLVPFADIQKKVVLTVPEKQRVIIYRRLMLKIAGAIAKKERADALVTGESLGQVSSQTMKNISVIGKAVSLLVFRPLVGMDKQEIIDKAKKIETYDISILPDQDCCQLFIPKHPATRSDIEMIEGLELKFNSEEMISTVLKTVEVCDIH